MSVQSTLSAAQRQAAEILATNDIHKLTIAEIATLCKVNERTIYRWKHDPVFVAYQNKISEQVMEDFIAEAYNELRKLVRAGRSDNARLKAIELTLKNRGKLRDIQENKVEIKDDRSDQAIQSEIEQLKEQLGMK